jgi:hypothetical protein
MSYTLYLKVKNHWGDQETEPYLYFYINCDEGKEPSFRPLQLADFIWKESSEGVKVIKDRTSACIRFITTEDENKEFMWVKLRSQTYNGQI